MKIIQTLVNCVDFQTRIIEVDTDWNTFKEKILSNIYNGISDDEFPVKKSYPIGKGLMFQKAKWFEVNQDDDCHLDITFTPNHSACGNQDERVCFLVLEE